MSISVRRCSGSDQVKGAVLQAMSFLLRISSVDEVVIFKICLEYWIILVTDLYNSQKLQAAPPALVHPVRKPTSRHHSQSNLFLFLALLYLVVRPPHI